MNDVYEFIVWSDMYDMTLVPGHMNLWVSGFIYVYLYLGFLNFYVNSELWGMI